MSRPAFTFTRKRFPIAAGKTIHFNDTVGIITGGGTSSGYAQAGAHVTTLRTMGTAQEFYDAAGRKLGPATTPVAGDNSAGADGDMYVEVQTYLSRDGGFVATKRTNDTGGTPLTQADCGSVCYVLDGVTVTGASSGNSKGGLLDSFNSDGTVNVILGLGV